MAVSNTPVVISEQRLCQFNQYVEQYSSCYWITLHHSAILTHNASPCQRLHMNRLSCPDIYGLVPKLTLCVPLGCHYYQSPEVSSCATHPNIRVHPLSISQIDSAAATKTEFTHIHKSNQHSRRLLGILCRRWNSTVWPVWLDPVSSQSFWTGTLWKCSDLQH